MHATESFWSSIAEEVRQTLKSYLIQLRKQLGTHLEAIIVYGSLARGEFVVGRSNINILLVVKECSRHILTSCGTLQRRWAKEGIVAPLLVTEEDLKQSFDLFPLEYGEIKEHHVLLEGQDPFLTCQINYGNLRVQCEQEIRGNLLRVRQRFIEGWARPEAIQALLPISFTALLPCLRSVLRLLGHPSNGSTGDTLDRLSGAIQFDQTVLQEVFNMKRGMSSPGVHELPYLYERYLQTMYDLVCRVEALKVEGRL